MRLHEWIRRTGRYWLGFAAVALILLAEPHVLLANERTPAYPYEYQPNAATAGVNDLAPSQYSDAADAAVDLPPDYFGPIGQRPNLTGDWFGARSLLRDRGITFDVLTTQYYQGVAGGGLDQRFKYGGRNDYFITLDGEKLGLWQGLSLKLHGETRYGESANFLTGALSPVNEYLLIPGSQGVVSGLTAFEFDQYLSENDLVFFGKINLLDHIRQPLTGAICLQGFMNTSLMFNTILARTLPFGCFGLGYVRLRDGEPVLSLAAYDTRSAPTTSVFNDLFGNGVVLYGVGILPTCFLNRPGHQGIEGVYSSGKYTNLQNSPYLDPISGLALPSPPTAGTWALGYFFDQALWVSPDDPARKWGVFGKLGIADNNPNPLQWTAMAGISGSSPLRNRTTDTFGIGYYHLGLSRVLTSAALPTTPLGDENGVELYYNYRFTPWCQITPDLQFIDPFQLQVKSSTVVGLRAQIIF